MIDGRGLDQIEDGEDQNMNSLHKLTTPLVNCFTPVKHVWY